MAWRSPSFRYYYPAHENWRAGVPHSTLIAKDTETRLKPCQQYVKLADKDCFRLCNSFYKAFLRI